MATNLNFTNFESVSERSLAISTVRTYRGCIRKLQEKLSDAEKAEYLDDEGKLIKALDGTIASRIVHLNQIISNQDGITKFKTKACCEQYISALKY